MPPFFSLFFPFPFPSMSFTYFTDLLNDEALVPSGEDDELLSLDDTLPFVDPIPMLPSKRSWSLDSHDGEDPPSDPGPLHLPQDSQQTLFQDSQQIIPQDSQQTIFQDSQQIVPQDSQQTIPQPR
jgi:hypothetical protein